MLSFWALSMYDVQAYEHEVWQSGNLYYWKTFDVTRGSSTDLSTAIQGALGTGQREVHILCGGTLSASISIPSWDTKIYAHNHTFVVNHGGYGVVNGWDRFELYDITLTGATNMGIRSSRGSNLRFVNCKVSGGSIGMRIDSHPSRPYDNWVSNLYVQDCTFENLGSHGLETYGIQGVSIWGITARNCGGCGVLLNQSTNGTIGTVDAYRCSYGGGYAGLRFANNCDNITANMLYARECGRGFFVLSGSKNCTLKNCEIIDCVDQWGTGRGIWLENVENCAVEAGCSNSGVSAYGPGTYANVSTSCGSDSEYYHMQSRLSGKCISIQDGSTSDNANILQQDCNGTYWRQQWLLNDLGNGYFQIKSRHSGKCMRASGDNIVQYTCYDDYWTEMFTREATSDGYFIYRNRDTNKCLRVQNSATGSGVSIVLDDCNSSFTSQQFERVRLAGTASASVAAASIATDELALDHLSVYPTIVTNELNVNLAENISEVELQVLNSTGIVMTMPLNGSNTLDLSGLQPGLYIVKVITGDQSGTYKIIKK